MTDEGMEDVSKLPNLPYALRKRGGSDADVRKALGENLLRVIGAAVEKSAVQFTAEARRERIPESLSLRKQRVTVSGG